MSTNGEIPADVSVELEDVPEMGYYNTDKPHPRGEICVRTKHMTMGYYKMPQETAAAYKVSGSREIAR